MRVLCLIVALAACDRTAPATKTLPPIVEDLVEIPAGEFIGRALHCKRELDSCRLRSPDGIEFAIFEDNAEWTSDTECQWHAPLQRAPVYVSLSWQWLALIETSHTREARFRCAR
jgi:hypothetical protein